jgi:hypothetical protein
MRYSKMINQNKSNVGQRPGLLAVMLLVLATSSQNVAALGETTFVETSSSQNSFALCSGGEAATVLVDANDWPGVARAAGDLAADINRVTGKLPAILSQPKSTGKNAVIIGTIGKSEFINQLIREKKIDASDIAGKWESFFLQVVPQPFPRRC